MEEQVIIRFPEDVAESIRAASISSSTQVNFDITAADGVHGFFHVILTINGIDSTYNAQLIDLPTVCETHKTLDHIKFFKSGTISRILWVLPHGIESIADIAPLVDSPDHTNVLAHGITPPLQHVVTRRFRPARRYVVDGFLVCDVYSRL